MHDVRALKNGTMAPDLSGATLTLDTGAGELELAIPADVLATLEHVAVHLAGEIASRRKAAGLDELVGLPMVENFSVENDAGECLLALAISDKTSLRVRLSPMMATRLVAGISTWSRSSKTLPSTGTA
jgi:hypothetical protein